MKKAPSEVLFLCPPSNKQALIFTVLVRFYPKTSERIYTLLNLDIRKRNSNLKQVVNDRNSPILHPVDIFEDSPGTPTQFAEVVLPVPIPKLFTYRIPRNMNEIAQVGQRAIVQFGDRKILTGLIAQIHNHPPKGYEAKYLLELLDEFPIVSDQLFALFHWISEYYMCTLGEVMNAGLPAGLKLSSESMVQLHPAFRLDESDQPFSDKELMVLRAVEKEPIRYSDLSKLVGTKHPYSLIKSLVGKESILLIEEVKEKFKPKTETRIRLTKEFCSPKKLETVFKELNSKAKQEAILLKYLQAVPVLQNASANDNGISKKALLSENASVSSLNTLIKHQILESYEVIISRFEEGESKSGYTPIALSEDQKQTEKLILKAFQKQDIVLLHGITGSGKTEIYVNLIKNAIEGGNQVLYLLPEIALTTQIVHRLKKIFGHSMGVYHSKFSDNERVEVWNGVLKGTFKFVVGVRSSIFLPFDSLGLIIVDEEHDASYKQHEPAPRYHARDVAMVLGQIHHAKVLLGSATPSVESYHHAHTGKFGFVSLSKRFGEAQLPEIHFADMAREKKNKTNKGAFSKLLLDHIKEAIQNNEQVIIFQNRRGFSPTVICEDCGWVPKCINCSVSLTYHQYRHGLICHYCGYRESLPSQCPTCTSKRVLTAGYGTEKLEEELKLIFEDVPVQRMDLDTTRNKTSYETIIDQFEKGETKILVGTQMVTKGLDFDRVSLVGIFNADKMIHFPDFRSYERAFQLITQVSGRAGRREKPGKVVIQTSNPNHPLLQMILHHSYETFVLTQIEDRQQHHYPPFSRLISITVKHPEKKKSISTARRITELLREQFKAIKVLGPGEPLIEKIRNQYLMNILIKIDRQQKGLSSIKFQIREIVDSCHLEKEHRNSKIIIDVDPIG